MSDYSELVANGSIVGGKPAVGSGAAVGQSQQGSGNMLPFEGKNLELPTANVDDVIGAPNADSMFAPINQGGGPFGQSLSTQLGDSAGFLGTPEAKGDNIAIEQLGAGERQAPPTFKKETGLGDAVSVRGGGATQGG